MHDDTQQIRKEVNTRKLYQFKEHFQEMPFNITLKLNNIKQLDRALTPQHDIYIYIFFFFDSRICKGNPLYKNMSPLEFEKYRTCLNVKRYSQKCLWLRDVLNAMSSDEHYNNNYVKQDELTNLVSFIDVTGEMKYFMSVFE